MSMETRINAIDRAREILSALQGWELDAATLRAERETDSFVRHWAGICNPAYPGAEVSINTSHAGPDRLSITARYPKDWEPYIQDRGGRAYTENITVAASKTPQQIARDIQKRLFEATGYLGHVAASMKRKEDSERALHDAETIARGLAKVAGTVIEYDRHSNEDRERYQYANKSEYRHSFTYHDSNYHRQVEGEVDRTADHEVTLKFSHLSPSQAEHLLQVWAQVAK